MKWDEYGTILHYNALRNNDASPLSIYQDSWPFHADQGQIGDCWLMATLMTIAQRRNLLEKIIPPNDFSLKHGIFLVRFVVKTPMHKIELQTFHRLFFHGEWNIVVVAGHFPRGESGCI